MTDAVITVLYGALFLLLGVLVFLFLLLFVPVRYSFTADRKGITAEVSLFFGLLGKRKTFPDREEEKQEEKPDRPVKNSSASPPAEGKQEEKTETAERPAAPETSIPPEISAEAGKDGAPEKDEGEISSREAQQELDQILDAYDRALDEEREAGREAEMPETEEDVRPSLWAQIRFAVRNGLAEKAFSAGSALLRHSFPGRWEARGEFGTSDPMHTGVLCGLTRAFFCRETKDVVWNYVEPKTDLTISAGGRILPLYAVYIVLRLILSKQAREFYHFRKGRKGKWTKN